MIKKVQSGGSFDIDWEIISPTGQLYQNGHRARQGDYVFPAKEVGEYAFCFSNSMSTFSEKVIDFDISAEHEVKTEGFTQNNLPHPVPGAAEQKEIVKEAVMPLKSVLMSIEKGVFEFQRNQKWFRTREHRNFATVSSSESSIFWFSLIETTLIVMMSVFQVYVIRIFFKSSKIILV
jgi:hypothetical protein